MDKHVFENSKSMLHFVFSVSGCWGIDIFDKIKLYNNFRLIIDIYFYETFSNPTSKK